MNSFWQIFLGKTPSTLIRVFNLGEKPTWYVINVREVRQQSYFDWTFLENVENALERRYAIYNWELSQPI